MIGSHTCQSSNTRQWSGLSNLQLGRYGELYARLQLLGVGMEVYTTEVDDRAIDFLVRTGPGRCLELQVKSVRLGAGAPYVFVRKKCLGKTTAEIEKRLRGGFVLCLVVFQDGQQPDVYLIPGTRWLTPDSLFRSYDYPDGKSDPEFGLTLSPQNLLEIKSYLADYGSARELSSVLFKSE